MLQVLGETAREPLPQRMGSGEGERSHDPATEEELAGPDQVEQGALSTHRGRVGSHSLADLDHENKQKDEGANVRKAKGVLCIAAIVTGS